MKFILEMLLAIILVLSALVIINEGYFETYYLHYLNRQVDVYCKSQYRNIIDRDECSIMIRRFEEAR